MTETGGTNRRPGFRGVRNTDTTAATRALQTKARTRKVEAAYELLIEEGYLVVGPRERNFIHSGDSIHGPLALLAVESIVRALRTS